MAAGPPEQIPAIENTIDFLASSVPRRTVLGAHARFEIAESSFHALTSPQQKALEDAAETGERKVDYGKDIVVVKLDAKVDAKHNRWKRKDPNTHLAIQNVPPHKNIYFSRQVVLLSRIYGWQALSSER